MAAVLQQRACELCAVYGARSVDGAASYRSAARCSRRALRVCAHASLVEALFLCVYYVSVWQAAKGCAYSLTESAAGSAGQDMDMR